MQYYIYDDCAVNYGVNNTWLAFIDADEFFDLPGGQTLDELLRQMEPLLHIGSLGVNWKVHTSNGRLTPAKSVRKADTKCVDNDPENNGLNSYNKYVKSIVRRKFYEGSMSPHNFRTGNGSVLVGEFADPINYDSTRQPPTHDRVVLHHYMVKSRQEFEEKMNRSIGMADARDWAFWDSVENAPSYPCTEMLKWAEAGGEEEEDDEKSE